MNYRPIVITDGEIARFNSARQQIFQMIKECLEIDGHCKSYEGAMRIHVPNYFEERDNDGRWPDWSIEVDSYLVCEHRGVRFDGTSLSHCLTLLEDWLSKAKEKHDVWFREESECSQ